MTPSIHPGMNRTHNRDQIRLLFEAAAAAAPGD
jgi:hypothetical protein